MNDQAQTRDETRRPMVERATAQLGGGAPKQAKLLEEFSKRLNECRQRTIDAAARIRSHNDAIMGALPEDPTEGPSRTIPHSDGALGMAFSELSMLESSLSRLEETLPRLDHVA